LVTAAEPARAAIQPTNGNDAGTPAGIGTGTGAAHSQRALQQPQPNDREETAMAYIKGTNNSEVLDVLDGVTDGNDTIFGYGGNDIIAGHGGDDNILGGEGADYIDGGSGSDTVTYIDSAVGVGVDLQTTNGHGHGYGGTAEGDKYINVENVTGSYYADHIIGNGDGNVLRGEAGHDILKGGGGNDTLIGGTGDDLLVGGAGTDWFYGGDGIDTVNYADSSSGVTVKMISGPFDPTAETFQGVENVHGSSYDDELTGDDLANKLTGGDGHDKLDGGTGNDVLLGGNGNDIIRGAWDGDTTTGGAGADTFVWNMTEEMVLGVQTDVITDFNAALGDKIDVHGIDANEDVAGNQAFTFIGTQDYSGAGQIRVVTDGVDTYLAFNTDSASDNEGAIRLTGMHDVADAWFVL
jgi:Ca2+-binding RTX toxin-like protein